MNQRSTRYLFAVLTFFSLSFASPSVMAQLSVSDGYTAQQLVEFLVGNNVAILNPTLNCPNGNSGQFEVISSNLPIPEGIVLSTGAVKTTTTQIGLDGPASLSNGQDNFGPSDPELDVIIGGSNNQDACVLEFDFVPDVDSQSTLRFNYAFASEEYPEWACSGFNDVFAFLLTGPGITNPLNNIALVPGTNIPVAINSINDAPNGTSHPISNCNNMGPGSPYTNLFIDNLGQNGQTVTSDGFTVKLEATAQVNPCDTYHIKLAIQDVGDGSLNSAVFLQKNSFSVDTVTLDLSGIIASDSGYLVEGCTPATIQATRTIASPSRKKICLSYGGTAINGLDYTLLPDSLIINPNQVVAAMILNPLQDGMDEPGYETIVIRRLNCCTLEPVDSVTIKIRDSLKMELLSEAVEICGRDTVVLHATGDPAFTYSWTPSADVQNPNDTLTLAFPPVTTTYTVTATFQGCPPVQRSFVAGVEPIPEVTIMNDTALCLTDPLPIRVDVQPASFTPYNYLWFPTTALSDPTVKEPTFWVDGAGIYHYVLAVQTPLGCTGLDTFSIETRPAVNLFDVSDNFTVKYGDVAQLHADGAVYYTWTPDRQLDFPNSSSPNVTAFDSTTFTVLGMNEWGCKDTAYVKMDIDYTMLETIPSAFSPNGDGRNEKFGLGSMKFQRLIEFRVFNRWGQELYSTTDANRGWDGTYKGVPQEIGVYHYIIRVTRPDGQLKTYKGDVTLIR